VTTDLFGRTEAQLLEQIERAKRRLAIADVYRGNEGLALKLEMMRANIRVDERCLARLRGERITHIDGESVRPNLSGQELQRWRDNLAWLSRGRHLREARAG
jgi:hypothetical protein